MPNRRQVKLLRQNEARSFVDAIGDPKTKRLVELASEPALQRFQDGERLPIADFDALFFVEGLYRSLSCHRRLAAILSGADIRWFPEEDEAIRDATFCPLPEKIESSCVNANTFSLDPLIRGHQANWLTCSLHDIGTVQIVGTTLACFTRHLRALRFADEPVLPQPCPYDAIDLLFCAEVLIEFCGRKSMIEELLSN